MTSLSRRSFLAGFSTLPLALSFGKVARGSAQTFIRHDAMSPQGQDMLKTYAAAVRTMMSSPEGSPTGWLFQWYTHHVRPDRTKASEIARIYHTPGPQKDLAQAMWDTCQAHFKPPQFQKFFLPWHRMYVFYLERIVRKISGRADFALPYWNYTSGGAGSGPAIPKQFRLQGDPTFGSLFVEKRNPVAPADPQGAKVNAGEPIDLHDPGALDPVALEECDFLPSEEGAGGFSPIIDGGLHGNVHVLVGNNKNMGSVPWAAFDPIFWLHHCNIDRLWESWNKLGGSNPTGDSDWMGKQFVFADENGKRVERAVREFLDIAALGYSYDSLLKSPKPQCQPAPLSANLFSARLAQRRASVNSGPVRLQPSPVRVTLEPTPAPLTESPNVTLNSRVETLPPSRRLYLVVKGLRAEAQPGVLYHLYMDLPPNTTPKPGKTDPHYVGTINFFEASAGAGDHGEHTGDAATASFSVNVTGTVKRLQARKLLSTKPALTIAPAGRPAEEAMPLIGEISLVEQ